MTPPCFIYHLELWKCHQMTQENLAGAGLEGMSFGQLQFKVSVRHQSGKVNQQYTVVYSSGSELEI